MTLQPPVLPAGDREHRAVYDRRPLERLLRINAAGLARLADPDGDHDRELIVELLTTSCLLELARLASARLDLVSHLQAATDVLTELFPCTGCAIELHAPGLDAVAVAAGVPPEVPAVEAPLVVAGDVVGRIRFGPLRIELPPTDFFLRAAEELSTGVAAVVEAERLRRQASVAASHQAASSLSADDVERGLRRLVQALAAWPGVVAARLDVEHAAAGVPLFLRAGWWDGEGPHLDVEVQRAGIRVGLRRGRRDTGSTPSEPALEAVVTELEKSLERIDREHRLARESETDPLTGAGNRRRLHLALGSTLARARLEGERVALLALDLDHFKRVNDTLGHDVGDAVLVAAVRTLRLELRPWDELIRSGGEEFIVVAPACDVIEARRLGDRLLAALPEGCASALPVPWHQSASVGVAVFPDMADEARTLLRLADGALYRAKRSGRAMVCVAQPGDALSRMDDEPAPTPPHVVADRVLALDDALARWSPAPPDQPPRPDQPRPVHDGGAGPRRRVLARVRRSLRGHRPAS